MLSIGKITAGTADYHQRQIAAGRDDYYAGKGEAPGEWGGAMAAGMGLEGTITAEAHAALMAGRDPATGEQLAERGSNTKVLGYDLTFSAPKSVSLVFAGGEEGESAAVVRAHERAVDSAMAYLEREACFVRRGHGGEQTERAAGFLGARYRHRMSRLEDPQLHTHSVISSAALGPDGRWTALHGRELYRHAKAAGHVYQAALRENVRRELGWAEWGPVTNGMAELAGFDPEVLRAFSKRSDEIDERVAELVAAGELARGDSKGARERAALATRAPKAEVVDTIPWRERIGVQLAEHGLGRAEWAALRGHDRAAVAPLDGAAVGARLTGAVGLTEKRNTFADREAVIEFAAALGQGGQLEEVDLHTRRFLDRADVVAVSAGEQTHTTADLLAAEQRIVAGAVDRQGERAGVLDSVATQARLDAAGRTLNPGQRAAFDAITSSGRGVDPVEALAGTGKTYLAGALNDAYSAAGYRVMGAAPTGRAVTELKQQAGIEQSWTLTRLAGDLERYDGFGRDRAVVIVDEIGMASTREAAVVAAHAQAAGVKLIAIGDSGQLSSVAAGGALGALTREIGAHELTEVVRQIDPVERARLAEVHDGRPDRYLAHKTRAGELELHRTAADTEAAAVNAWANAQESGSWGDAVLVARDNDTRQRLNDAARRLARDQGQLGEDLEIGGTPYAAGDRIITRRNDHFHAVDNGTRGTVRQVDPGAGGLVFETDAGGRRRLPAAYVAEHVEHAYAVTGHGAQGGTVRWSGVVGSPEDFSQNWAYTALSRGREPTRLFLNEGLPPALARREADRAEIAPGGHEQREDPLTRLSRRMHQRDDELLAMEQLQPPELPDAPEAPRGGGRELEPRENDQPPLPGVEDNPLYEELERALGRERAKTLALEVTEVGADLGQLQTTELLEITDRARETLTTIPRQARRSKDQELLERATARVAASEQRLAGASEALGEAGRRQRRELQERVWGLEKSLAAARKEYAESSDRVAAHDIDRWLEEHEMELVEAAKAGRELAARRADAHWRAQRTAQLDADPALEALLGARPEAPQARERWERAAAAQESYRLQYGDLPAGHEPDELPERQAADWHHAHQLAEDLHQPAGEAGQLLRGLDLDDYGPDLGP